MSIITETSDYEKIFAHFSVRFYIDLVLVHSRRSRDDHGEISQDDNSGTHSSDVSSSGANRKSSPESRETSREPVKPPEPLTSRWSDVARDKSATPQDGTASAQAPDVDQSSAMTSSAVNSTATSEQTDTAVTSAPNQHSGTNFHAC